MNAQRLQERIEDYQRATRQLATALARPVDEFMRDAVIQRFKVAYELAWKMLKLRLEQEAVLASTPRLPHIGAVNSPVLSRRRQAPLGDEKSKFAPIAAGTRFSRADRLGEAKLQQ